VARNQTGTPAGAKSDAFGTAARNRECVSAGGSFAPSRNVYFAPKTFGAIIWHRARGARSTSDAPLVRPEMVRDHKQRREQEQSRADYGDRFSRVF
jgi:hypothetical protein